MIEQLSGNDEITTLNCVVTTSMNLIQLVVVLYEVGFCIF